MNVTQGYIDLVQREVDSLIVLRYNSQFDLDHLQMKELEGKIVGLQLAITLIDRNRMEHETGGGFGAHAVCPKCSETFELE